MRIHKIIHFKDAKTPSRVNVVGKTATEKNEVSQLVEVDKHIAHYMIDDRILKTSFNFLEQNSQTVN